jgi:putative endonuclease
MTWSVYIVRTRNGTLYTGIATDVERRYREHVAQGPRCARYLRAHRPAALVFAQEVGDHGLAARLEARLKRLTRRDKERLVVAGRFTFDSATAAILWP